MAEEKRFELRVRRLLSTYDNVWLLKTWSNGVQRTGVPDILACFQGKFFGIEVKASSGKPSMLQLKELKSIDEACGLSFLLYPKDFELFKSFLKQYSLSNYTEAYEIYQYFHDMWLEKYERLMNDDSV